MLWTFVVVLERALYCAFLPSVYDIWHKVMFLHVSVIPFLKHFGAIFLLFGEILYFDNLLGSQVQLAAQCNGDVF